MYSCAWDNIPSPLVWTNSHCHHWRRHQRRRRQQRRRLGCRGFFSGNETAPNIKFRPHGCCALKKATEGSLRNKIEQTRNREKERKAESGRGRERGRDSAREDEKRFHYPTYKQLLKRSGHVGSRYRNLRLVARETDPQQQSRLGHCITRQRETNSYGLNTRSYREGLIDLYRTTTVHTSM